MKRPARIEDTLTRIKLSLSEAAVQLDSHGRAIDRQFIADGATNYYYVKTPANVRVALLSRLVTSFERGAIEYTVWVKPASVTVGADIDRLKTSVNSPAIFKRATDVDLTGAIFNDEAWIPASQAKQGDFEEHIELKPLPQDTEIIIAIVNKNNGSAGDTRVKIDLSWVEDTNKILLQDMPASLFAKV